MTHSQPYRLHQSLGYHLSITSRVQERRLDDKLKHLGLTRTTWCILLAVGTEELSQPSDIADFVGIDRTATSRALRQMEDFGLLERTKGTGDRRTRTVQLTALGQDSMHTATPFALENAQIMAQQLSASEHAELIRLLGKLRSKDDPRLNTL